MFPWAGTPRRGSYSAFVLLRRRRKVIPSLLSSTGLVAAAAQILLGLPRESSERLHLWVGGFIPFQRNLHPGEARLTEHPAGSYTPECPAFITVFAWTQSRVWSPELRFPAGELHTAGSSGVAVHSTGDVPACLSAGFCSVMLVFIADSLLSSWKPPFANDPSFLKVCLYSCRTPNREMLSWLNVVNVSNYFLSAYRSSQG